MHPIYLYLSIYIHTYIYTYIYIYIYINVYIYIHTLAFKVVSIQDFGAKKYTVWVHGPEGSGPSLAQQENLIEARS